jgi:uncharacterized protein (TIGR02145 family)
MNYLTHMFYKQLPILATAFLIAASITSTAQNSASGRLLYNNDPSKPIPGIRIILKTITGISLASDTTDSLGEYTFSGLANGAYALDAVINGGKGGSINSTDALLASLYYSLVLGLPAWATVAADVNGNGTVNITDAILIGERGANPDSSFITGEYCRPIINFTAQGSPQLINLQAMAIGDVNGSFVPIPSEPVLVLDTAYGNGPQGVATVRFTQAGFGIIERGICWSGSPNPDVSGNRSVSGSGGFNFTHHFMGVDPNTMQYIRAYARTSQGIYYSNERSFISRPGLRCSGSPTITDQDGFTYYTVLVGNQCWMQSNLRTTKYRNGQNITSNLSNAQWQTTTAGAYGIYNQSPFTNTIQNDSVWGKLYNHYAVLDSRGLCPLGWRIPTDSDWNVLIKSLDPQADTAATTTVQTQSTTAGGSLKSNRNQPLSGGWNSPNTGATNLSGFSGLPSGYRTEGGTFNSAGNFGNWWSSLRIPGSGTLPPRAWNRGVDYNNTRVTKSNPFVTSGFPVRCIRN